jgi:hypothetical protein
MQEGYSPFLFGLWSFDNKTTNFVLVSTNFVLWCFYVFCEFLISFKFFIMCRNINYFFLNIFYFYFILFIKWGEKHSKEIQANLENTYGDKKKH